jgi:hypothetical protein
MAMPTLQDEGLFPETHHNLAVFLGGYTAT